MADLYVVDVSMNLTASLPDAVLSELRRHLGLGETADGQEDDAPITPSGPLAVPRNGSVAFGSAS